MSASDPAALFESEKEKRWINKQRVLVLASRGSISTALIILLGSNERHRHLMLDLIGMLPHSKKESKIEKRDTQNQISELCHTHSCTSFVYFEAKRKQDLYVWIGRFPHGPSIKFLVENGTTCS